MAAAGVRLFAALELPAEPRAALAAWAQSLPPDPALRLVAPENLHVTLVFLGAQKEEGVEAIAGAMTAAAQPVEELSVAGAAWLPSGRPAVLVADLTAGERVLALQQAVVRALGPWRVPEERPFRPHVTVARVRRGRRPEIAIAEPPRVSFPPAALVLYRSRPGGRAAVYEPVATVAL
jgi:2'-5' RNA ligase